MRLAFFNAIVITAGLASSALAQTAAPSATPAPPPPPAAPPAAAPAAPATPDASAPAAAAPATAAPAAPAAPEPPPPPPPPPPPTDPVAIAELNVLEKVCVPATAGGDWNALTKALGMKKSSQDGSWTLKGQNYSFKVNAPGSNPNQCIVDIIQPVNPDAPLVVALHNWATYGHGYTLLRNDKNTLTGQELTTRSWENNADGKAYALVFTTTRKPDGTPLKGSSDVSQMIYSETKVP
jgi:hypothetical protein